MAIATLGVVRSATLQQSSWQGASFGMFATYDNRASRTVVVQVAESGTQRRVRLPSDLEDDATRLTVVPTDDAARRLAEEVLDLVPGADEVEVDVWRLQVRTTKGALLVTTSGLAHGRAAP